MTDAVAPGGTVGILGGGQLGRMLAIAAAQLGLKAHVYAPEADPPAADVARCTRGAWDDAGALRAFAGAVDVVTYEFENVPAAVVDALEPLVPVRPGRKALAVAQDRVTEKRFLNRIGVATAPFAPVDDAESLAAALERVGTPAILKTRRFGYDGKGQARIAGDGDAPGALAAMGGAPAVLEGLIRFSREISVIAARGADGAVACFDPGENVHEDGILRSTTVPAGCDAATAAAAKEIAARILAALDYVGVIGVEFFETDSRALLVNEIAPRVHNTGHWTIEATANDQFRQHVKAVCLWPLGDPARHADAVMENLIGDEALDWARLSAAPGTALHLYGKAEMRPGRKMGHTTRLRAIAAPSSSL
ncbi:5-(carboxyamino)imidazole ribonucleotide synthase [Pikeienuella piscinae]|uniref:N5-carboxyaminoimidazole ribonucleotide synthase n=1 Tax=Pikeienuella piscinae TaxID=2748098 RepID=A0A7L5BVY6_9RHOB|nr:5-(carboxyamino)imidazole ribonucleotide synthase [Pikeienuella piscinae]QIE55581.1 5-(carboxyamino)imidazole ribonucleotide synthase [Pikeienuella piscinae]